jgi:glyoxylase-like metal-dependent hydrolase (beta-lactamase superfamily II)
MTEQIVQDHTLEALHIVAGWPEADRNVLVTLAATLAATGADADGAAFFGELAHRQPGQVAPLALAGFFQVRAGLDVPAGLAKLDQAAQQDLGLPQYYRGLALAGLPPAAGQAKQAVADLEFVLAVRDQFPSSMIRAVHHGLAAAHAALGNTEQAAAAAAASGLAIAPPGVRLEFSGFWANPADGFHFSPPRISEPAPGIQVAQGYDFGDFAFVATGDGVVAIDGGTAPRRVAAALADAGWQASDVTHVIVTHSHFDHAGGIGALLGPGTRVIAQAGFPAELAQQRDSLVPFEYFTGSGAGFGRGEALAAPVAVDQPIAEPTTLTIGGTEFVLFPSSGGETSDALMAYLPASGVLFAGDVMMPYLGAPFFAEGSPDGLLDVLEFITRLEPRLLIHGHTTLADLFTMDAVAGLLPALTKLREYGLAGISAGKTLIDLLDGNLLPEVLREHPAAVLPYLVFREHFLQRLHSQHTGYWQNDGQGMEPVSPGQRAAALDLLAEGKPERFAEAAAALLDQRDYALALEIAAAGLARHPGAVELRQLRQRALYRLMERHQLQDPFRFLVYAEMAGVQLGPPA